MSILDQAKTPAQLRAEEHRREMEFLQTALEMHRRMFPDDGMIVTTVYAPGRKPRRYYSYQETIRL
jgi:hypothetical protein